MAERDKDPIYEQVLTVGMLASMLEAMDEGDPVIVDAVDRWGHEEFRTVVSAGETSANDSCKRYLVLYTMEGRDDDE